MNILKIARCLLLISIIVCTSCKPQEKDNLGVNDLNTRTYILKGNHKKRKGSKRNTELVEKETKEGHFIRLQEIPSVEEKDVSYQWKVNGAVVAKNTRSIKLDDFVSEVGLADVCFEVITKNVIKKSVCKTVAYGGEELVFFLNRYPMASNSESYVVKME
ncbi:hypothetical protein [Tenacibaculum amylolyticum]|uniref:hypothetical protein n=1 Tax=Tenacibaculum amylolyticum TaxID=104269 RepID=UPI0038944E35